MPRKAKVDIARGLSLDRHIDELRQKLSALQSVASRRKPAVSLEQFDEEAEALISQVFGSCSDQLEGYQYAKLGEVRLESEQDQDKAARDTDREGVQQRKLVLDSCLAQLVVKKASRPNIAKGSGDQLNGKKVADYTSPDVRSVHRSASIKEAGRLLQKWKVGSLLVDDGSRYIGIITDTDLSRKAVAKGLDPNTTTVTACMTKALVTIEDSEALSEAVALMKKNGIRHLPVTEDGTIIGVLSVADLLRAYEGSAAF
jgi:predicted transcriptional regulator